MPLRTLLIDNYDSYTYNLFQLIAEVHGGMSYCDSLFCLSAHRLAAYLSSLVTQCCCAQLSQK